MGCSGPDWAGGGERQNAKEIPSPESRVLKCVSVGGRGGRAGGRGDARVPGISRFLGVSRFAHAGGAKREGWAVSRALAAAGGYAAGARGPE